MADLPKLYRVILQAQELNEATNIYSNLPCENDSFREKPRISDLETQKELNTHEQK
jgi:hypothetical protein